jgi:hypothetical protein
MFYSYSSLGALFPLHLNSKMFPLSVPYIIPLSVREKIGGRIHISPYISESEILQSSSSGGSGCSDSCRAKGNTHCFDFEKAFDPVNLALSKSNLSCMIHIIGYTN